MQDNSIEAEIEKIMSSNDESGGKKKKKKLGKKKKILLFSLLGVVILFILINIFTGRKNNIAQVETATLTKSNIEDDIAVTGLVGGTDSVTITSGLHAKITEINVKEGDEVVAGQTVLAKIDTAELQNRLETARGQYKLALANRDEKKMNDEAAYTKASENLKLVQNDYNRKKELVDAGALAPAELESANNALVAARSELAQYKLKAGKVYAGESYDIQVENAKLELERLEKDMENATLIAPISGTVTRVYAKVGRFADQAIDNNPTLITIEKLDKLELNVSVSEYSISKIKIGQKAIISADILGEGNTVEGVVDKISPSGELKQGTSSNERVIPVKISIADRKSLISGISAKAKIINSEKKDVYTVPIAAVGDDGNGNSIMQFIVDEKNGKGKIKLVPISTGIESEVNIEVLENSLQGLDTTKELKFVSKYDTNLTEGMEVNLISSINMDMQAGGNSNVSIQLQ